MAALSTRPVWIRCFLPVSGMKDDDAGAWSQGSTSIRATVGLSGHLHPGMINIAQYYRKETLIDWQLSQIFRCKHPKKSLEGLMNTDKGSKNPSLKI